MATRFKIGIGALAAVGVLALIGAGGYYLWKSGGKAALREDILSALPGVTQETRLDPAVTRAIEGAYRSIEEGPDPVQGLARLARLYQANGLLGEAIQSLDLLLGLDPDNPKWPHLLAFILAGYGELEVALPLWERTMELDPGYLPAQLRRAEAFIKLNRTEDAKDAFLVVLFKDPENAHALHGLARLAIANDDYETAHRYLARSMESTGGRVGVQLIVTVLDRLGKTREANALRGLAQALEQYSDIPDPWILELMDECYDPYQLISGGGYAVYAGDVEGGVELMRRAIQLDPDNATAHFQLGIIYKDNGQPNEAMPNFERACQYNPQLSDAWLHRANIYIETGFPDKGDELLVMGLVQNPNSPGLHLRWAERLYEMGRLKEAIPQLQKSIQLRPQEPGAYLTLSRIYLDLKQPEKARQAALDSLDGEAFNPGALSILTLIAISTGNETEAREWLEKLPLQPRITPKDREDLVGFFVRRFGYRPDTGRGNQ